MKEVICQNCGSTEFTMKNNSRVCDYCRTEYEIIESQTGQSIIGQQLNEAGNEFKKQMESRTLAQNLSSIKKGGIGCLSFYISLLIAAIPFAIFISLNQSTLGALIYLIAIVFFTRYFYKTLSRKFSKH